MPLRRFRAVHPVVLALSCSPVFAYEFTGYVWEQPRATIAVDIGGTSPSGQSWDTAFLDAMDEWNAVVPGFRFESSPTYSHPCAGYTMPDDFRQGVDFYPTVCDTPFNDDTLAVTFWYSDARDEDAGYFTDVDIIFNSNISWDIYSGPGQFFYAEFGRVAGHELGHFAGLDHETFPLTLMHPFDDSIESPTVDDIAGMRALYPDGNATGPFVVSLEEPVDGLVHGGIGNLRGWAVAEDGIDRIEIFIDGQYVFDAPFGGSRTDVAAQFPDIPGAEQSGFSLAYGYSNLSAGVHTVTARAYTLFGDVKESSSTFTVVAFHKDFIFANDTVETSQAVMTAGGDEIMLQNIEIDGRQYDLKLKWRTAEQGFEIIQIQ